MKTGLPRLSEREFMGQVIQFGRLNKWKVAHFRPAMTSKGWRTAVSGDGAGFVDLVLVRERVLWVELKAEDGKLTPEQKTWWQMLVAARQEVYVFRPSDWPTIERVLGGAS